MNSELSPHYVLDSSALVALLADAGPDGDWVTDIIIGAVLSGPSLLPYEAANILRRNRLAGLLDETAATLAHTDLCELTLNLYPHSTTAQRVWELRDNLTVYDASYIALAEMLNVPFVTLDLRIARAFGPQCKIITPPES